MIGIPELQEMAVKTIKEGYALYKHRIDNALWPLTPEYAETCLQIMLEEVGQSINKKAFPGAAAITMEQYALKEKLLEPYVSKTKVYAKRYAERRMLTAAKAH